MLQYLIVLLDDTSVSYCHYSNAKTERKLIALSDLKEAVLFNEKESDYSVHLSRLCTAT